MAKASIGLAALVLCAGWVGLSYPTAPAADGKDSRFDVNDVSFLWPAPNTTEDVAALISLEEKLADGTSSILSQGTFDTLLTNARAASVTDSAGRETKMRIEEAHTQRTNWKIAGVRIDPSAPGTAPILVKARGSMPQLRLIVQPVTVKDKAVKVHDVTMHLAYSYVKGFKPPASEKEFPIAIPDEDAFRVIVKDLASLKESLNKAGVTTEGKLSVHPGFTNKAKGFPEQVKAFLKKHLHEKRLVAMAFMGIDPPDPWIFLAMKRQPDGSFAPAPSTSLGESSTQMLILRGGRPVMPRPTTTNVDAKRGVSTSVFFPTFPKAKLEQVVFADLAELKYQDIPDLIAHPQRAHVFNTDCVSCHSESTQRADLGIVAGKSTFAYKLPAGISGVDEKVLPKTVWNVRNFGWFPTSDTSAVATVTWRTANEAAESAEFINGKYLGKKE